MDRTLDRNLKPLVIYHADCNDGFTAAWVAWRKFDGHGDYVSARHEDRPPNVEGRVVYMLDLCFARSEIIEMKEKAASLIILDHHKSAQADLAGLLYATFDMNRSGAGLAWDYFFPFHPKNALVEYVEDRDLWRWQMFASREINAVIDVKPRMFHEWEILSAQLNDVHLRNKLALQGGMVLQKVRKDVSRMRENARELELDGHKVRVVNMPYVHMSEVLHDLALTADYAIGWYQGADGRYAYSLRSNASVGDSGVDVSMIATHFGGGGHHHAAGFTSRMPPDDLWHLFLETPEEVKRIEDGGG